VTTFENLGLTAPLLRAVATLGYTTPMPIQEQVIPLLLNSARDVIGLAQTGTGKTGAFGLPLLQMINPELKAPQVLILSPTRELCIQLGAELVKFAHYLQGITIATIYGGDDMQRQLLALRNGVQVIVATPGRMNDLLNKRKKIDLRGLQTVVLDEADEMLKMGFQEELDAILEQTPQSKRTLFFSATMPPEILPFANNYLKDPLKICVGSSNSGADCVEHYCYCVRSEDRFLALKRIVDANPDLYGMVFCRTRDETKEIADRLIASGYNAEALHGDLAQAQRELVINKFRLRNLQLLVTTDVAARGLDIKDISHVINYNVPEDGNSYIHRSGRTGRAGKAGISIVIINLKEQFKIRRIEAKLRKTFTFLAVPGGKEICEKQLLHLVDRLQRIDVDHQEIDKFLPAILEKLQGLDPQDLIKRFVSLEFNRFLEYYKDSTDLRIPVVPNGERPTFQPGKETPGPKRNTGKLRSGGEEGFTRFHINLGHYDNLTPRELISLINRCTRSSNITIGKIELRKDQAIFDADERFQAKLLADFQKIEFNRKKVALRIYTPTSTAGR